MAEMLIAPRRGFRHLQFHRFTVEAMKRIALDQCRVDALAAKDPIEGACDRGGAGARRSGDGNDGMLG